ncbi:hypothetical protein MUP05_03630 [Candidatus Bathyarchaeota archaeon]|nr:hypothetical protein [Candidatus Bathyarchaeota archaeon]
MSPKNVRNLTMLIAIDSIGSILLPGNAHGFWYDLERIARLIAAAIILAIQLGTSN